MLSTLPAARWVRLLPAARWVRLLLAATAAAAIVVTAATPARSDAVRDQEMWVLNMVHAPAAWSLTKGQGVIVAVIDSGVYPHVSDLAGSVISGPDLSGVHTPPSNPSWGVHGTWMASLIAGHGHADGSGGIIGVAPESKVLSIRVVTDQGDPHFATYQHETDSAVQKALARAIDAATARGARVISMSLGYGATSLLVRSALQHALDKGVVVVASSGNSGGTARARRAGQAPYSFPADYPGVLGVGAVARNGAAASFSSDNLSVEVAAPGVKVPAQGRDGQYWLVSGTSPACALTAGVAALIKSAYPRLAPALVDQAITAGAQNAPSDGYDNRVGFGTVDAVAALAVAGRLNHDSGTGRGVRAGAHFGGGVAAIPPVPVPPRSRGPLLLYAVLAAGCLLLAGVAARFARRSRARAGGAGPGGEAGAGGPWPGGECRDRGTWPGATPWPDGEPGPIWAEPSRWGHTTPGPVPPSRDQPSQAGEAAGPSAAIPAPGTPDGGNFPDSGPAGQHWRNAGR